MKNVRNMVFFNIYSRFKPREHRLFVEYSTKFRRSFGQRLGVESEHSY